MKSIYAKFCLLFLLAVNSNQQVVSQGVANPDNFQKMVDILPPAPNAAALSKYGGIEVSQNTGAPNISIPLFEVKGKNISVPVSLNYSSSGIKVDEIASRAGMGWVMKSGGVITRTVRGFADETHTRKIPWGTFGNNWETYKFMKDVTDAWFYSGFDSEPDLFTFNYPGGGGSFVFDAGMNPVQETFSNQKIYFNFTGTDWNFKIVDANGTEFYFGGNGAVESNKRLSNCAKNFDGYTATAWYLKRIKHVSGEEIVFNYSAVSYTYDCGISQSSVFTYSQPRTKNQLTCPVNVQGCPGAQAQATAQPTCVNKTMVNGVLLQNILCLNTSQRVDFSYTDRQDCNDKLISQVSLVNTMDNITVRTFSLNFQHITSSVASQYQGETETGIDKAPYLNTLTESAPGSGVTGKIHRFTYLDPESRPRRLSYSQDHWGYFNGQHNNSLLPRPSVSNSQLNGWFPYCTANREPEGKFAQKGLLSKITYPTGGADSLVYESNSYVNPYGGRRLQHVLNCSATGLNNTTPNTKTSVIYIGGTQTVELNINVLNSDPGNFYDPIHDFGRVTITNSSGSHFDELISPGTSVTRYINLIGSETNTTAYTVTLIGQRSNTITAQIELKYLSGTITEPITNTITGGLRIKSVLTSNEGNVPIVKRYYYGNLNSLNISSSNLVQSIDYVKNYETRSVCFWDNNTIPPGINYCSRTAITSGSLKGLYDYKSSPVSYEYVVESIGENFEGGGTQTKFRAISDQRGQVIFGNDILNAPSTAFSNYANGSPTEIYQFKKDVNGSFVPVKKTELTYALDSRGFKSVWGYTINRKFELGPWLMNESTDSSCSRDPNCQNYGVVMGRLDDNIECFDMVRWEFPSYWIYNDTKKESIYDQNGQNPIVTLTTNYYDDAENLQLSRTEVNNSKDESIKTEYKYPDDFPGIYEEMTAKNIINPIVSVKTFNGSTPISELKNNYYKDVTANDYKISSIVHSLGTDANNQANALEQIGTISRYDEKGNICEFTGKDGIISTVIWGYNYIYPVAKISGAGYNTVAGFLPGGVSAIQTLDGQPLRDALNAIRTGLPGVQVSTYTYKHLIGVTSITDPVNRTSRFEYDGMGRLIHVFDPDGNVVKKNEYTYTINYLTKMGVFVNEQQLASFTCQNCNWGYQGSTVLYEVPAGVYFSVVSVAEANQRALSDISVNGQAYANKYGNCYTQTVCTTEGYKNVGCGCELGTKICIGSTQNADGTWNIQYKYGWSDGSYSQIYSSVSPVCTGEGYKQIGCNCVKGFKIYTSSVFVATPRGKMWQCTYHYHWPDGTDSQDYTELSYTSCTLSIE